MRMHTHPRTVAYAAAISLATVASCFAMGAAIATHIFDRLTRKATP